MAGKLQIKKIGRLKLAEIVAKQNGYTIKYVEEVLRIAFQTMVVKTLNIESAVQIPDFGSVVFKEHKERHFISFGDKENFTPAYTKAKFQLTDNLDTLMKNRKKFESAYLRKGLNSTSEKITIRITPFAEAVVEGKNTIFECMCDIAELNTPHMIEVLLEGQEKRREFEQFFSQNLPKEIILYKKKLATLQKQLKSADDNVKLDMEDELTELRRKVKIYTILNNSHKTFEREYLLIDPVKPVKKYSFKYIDPITHKDEICIIEAKNVTLAKRGFQKNISIDLDSVLISEIEDEL